MDVQEHTHTHTELSHIQKTGKSPPGSSHCLQGQLHAPALSRGVGAWGGSPASWGQTCAVRVLELKQLYFYRNEVAFKHFCASSQSDILPGCMSVTFSAKGPRPIRAQNYRLGQLPPLVLTTSRNP